MFRTLIDLDIHFTPWMSGRGRGVVLRQEIQVPFPPQDGLRVFSRRIDQCQDPMGLELRDVVWDMDRELFLAKTGVCDDDPPMLEIPRLLRLWLDLGWEFGSHVEAYRSAEDRTEEGIDEARERRTATVSRPRRQRRLTRVARALIRHMAETYDNDELAYAFDQTGLFFPEDVVSLRSNKKPEVQAFADAARRFEKMSARQQQRWQAVVSRYPSLRDLAER